MAFRVLAIRLTKNYWKITALPFEFHAALEEGDWLKALTYYQAHPFHCPPVDSYELLKLIMYKTKVKPEAIKQRFQESIKSSIKVYKSKAAPLEWEQFWYALNNGDSKTISMGLSGAGVCGPTLQIGVAAACAVLLKSCGKDWKKKLVDNNPFGAVTKTNLLCTTLKEGRWDLACELLSSIKLSRGDMLGIWPAFKTVPWDQCLKLMDVIPKHSIPFKEVIPHLLSNNCEVKILAEYLENSKVLGDPEVVSPLLDKCTELGEWEYVLKCMNHLADIGTITSTTYNAFQHFCDKYGVEETTKRLRAKGILLHNLTIEILEELCFD